MQNKVRFPSPLFGASLRPEGTVVAIMVLLLFLLFVLLFMTFTARPAQGQTYKVIYSFTGGVDGGNPDAGLIMDGAGNLYGVNSYGGGSPNCMSPFGDVGCGTAFELAHSGSGWTMVPLYQFQGALDGFTPAAALTFGPDGSLYGTTSDQSLGYDLFRTRNPAPSGDDCDGYACGTVFKIAPPANAAPNFLGGWTHTVLHRFQGYPVDGNAPYHSPVTFAADSTMYLTTYMGGTIVIGGGTVTTLKPSNGGWVESILYNFQYPEDDGHYPMSGVILDRAGNLDGTTFYDGRPYGGYGTVFQLTPSGTGWTENILHLFQGGSDGAHPIAGLISDSSGNLYGATAGGYPQPNATVFMLTPTDHGWIFKVLYTFDNNLEYPAATLAMDTAGNLYGTTYADSYPNMGHLFKLAPGPSGWTYTSVRDFCREWNCTDGGGVRSSVLVAPNGILYGTAYWGGTYGHGIVFEVTP